MEFGQVGASDYPTHKDHDRMMNYLKRHGAVVTSYIKDASKITESYKEDWDRDGVDIAGFWSRWFLWSHTDLNEVLSLLRGILKVLVEVTSQARSQFRKSQ